MYDLAFQRKSKKLYNNTSPRTTATNRGEKKFAKAVAKIQAEQLAAKKKPKVTTKEKVNTKGKKVTTKPETDADRVNEFVKSGMKKWDKENKLDRNI